MLVHAVRMLLTAGVVQVVVAAPAETVTSCRRLLRSLAQDVRLCVIAGGASRRASVAACLDELRDVDVVLVHDAARPLTPSSVAVRVLDALQGGATAVVPAVPVADTIKQVEQGVVVRTIERAKLFAVQTPQGFARQVLASAHASAPEAVHATDDAALVESLGLPVNVVEGAAEGFKITHPIDLRVAEAVLLSRRT